MRLHLHPWAWAVALALTCFLGLAAEPAGPTPYPDPATEAAWPGQGPIRVHGWMADNRAAFWKRRDQDQGAVVFAGDSLTAGWKLASAFPALKTANRGIGGDTSRGLRFRFQEDVLDLHPAALVLCIGSNDLSAHGAPAAVAGNIAAMVAAARAQNPQLPIVLCTVPPRDNSKAPTKPGAHADLNARIAKLAQEAGGVTVIDLVPLLGEGEGKPKAECFGDDRLHLKAPGYAIWTEAVQGAFTRLQIR